MSDKQLYVFGDHTIERDGESTTFNRPRTKSKLYGTERAQCRKCGEVFSRTSNFDKHRKGGICVDPESVGLILTEKNGNSCGDEELGVGEMDDVALAQRGDVEPVERHHGEILVDGRDAVGEGIAG